MRNFIGSKDFYIRVLKVMLPIIIQQGITNFVGLLDNIMVGQVGTEQMSGVAIANQLQFVFQLCVFGALAGAGIFCAQYYGRGDQETVRSVFRYKVWVSLLITLCGIGVFWFFRAPLIRLFLTERGAGDLDATLGYGVEYLRIMLVGMVPFAAVQLYASTMRETGETTIPMRAGIVAVLVNMAGNYILIFGHFGAPRMGVAGAALATTISRFVELAIVLIYARRKQERFPYFAGIYRTLKVPAALAKEITVKGMPLLLNELLWSLGITVLFQCYSTRGLTAVAAFNISNTVSNFFSIAMFAMGSAISILVGQELGAGEFERAKDTNRKMTVFGFLLCLAAAGLLALGAPLFPRIYNTTEEVRTLANQLLWMDAVFLAPRSLYNSCYFTLRSGGKALITFLFDSVSMWVVSIPAAMVLAHLTATPLLAIYLIIQCLDVLKTAAGLLLVYRGIWINNLTVSQGR